MPKTIIITRKIQLLFNTETKEQLHECFQSFYLWQNVCRKAANMVVSHHYIQDNIKDLFYFTDEVKVKLSNIEKDADGILTTSKSNTTYQLLSKHFKGEIPSNIFSCLNSQTVQLFNKERKDYFLGNKSLRNYKKNIPVPFSSSSIRNLVQLQNKNYSFTLFDIPFKTNFGKDLSGNQIIFERSLAGEYKLCDSSLQLKDNKLFMLAVFQFESSKSNLDTDSFTEAYLDINTPIVYKHNGTAKKFKIGSSDEFLHRRLAIQESLRRCQSASRFNRSGKGIHKKMRSTQHYQLMEKNYVETRMHQYKAKLINECLKNKSSKLILKNQIEKETEAKQDEEYLLRNWSYFSLKDKIQHACNKLGIELIVE